MRDFLDLIRRSCAQLSFFAVSKASFTTLLPLFDTNSAKSFFPWPFQLAAKAISSKQLEILRLYIISTTSNVDKRFRLSFDLRKDFLFLVALDVLGGPVAFEKSGWLGETMNSQSSLVTYLYAP